MAAPARADAPSSFLSLVNTLRKSVGVQPLTTNPGLTSVAQQWATHMASTGVLAHNPNLSTQAPTGWTKIGESIGDGFSLTAVYNVLAVGPYLANLIDPSFNQTGIGEATDSKGQVWLTEDFGDYPPPVPASMVFPTNGTTIFASPQTFSWGQALGATYYCLTVGTTRGGVDLANSGMLPPSQLTYTVPALPGGQPLWARIYSYIQGAWVYTDVSFTATGSSMAAFTQPTNGATNVATSQPFIWTGVPSATYYGLSIGTTPGATDVANSGPLPPTQTTFQPPVLPKGKTLSARLYSYIAGSWQHYVDISFTTAP